MSSFNYMKTTAYCANSFAVKQKAVPIKLHFIYWDKFQQRKNFYDAVIYILLNYAFPQRSPLKILKAPVCDQFSGPHRLLWFLFEQPAELNSFRLLYPREQRGSNVPNQLYLSSNISPLALRRFFEIRLYPFSCA